MDSRHSSASVVLTACLLLLGLLAMAPTAYAVSPGPSFLNHAESLGTNVVEIKRRGRGSRIFVPIAPSYLYYDYPYYYARGYYPTHIGRGFVYFGYPYAYYQRRYYSRYGGRCSYRRCVAISRYVRDPGSPRRRQFGACRCP